MGALRDANAWLLMTVGDNRQHGGNAGYDDQADVYYTWDSTVPNHANLQVGDPIALWDKERLLGISVIEEIEVSTNEKLLFKCAACGKAGIKARKHLAPRYKCYKCGNVFDVPHTQTTLVTEYRSRHDAAWTSLDDLLAGPELRKLCMSARSQLSMRQLRWEDFQAAIAANGAGKALERVLRRRPDYFFPQGHQFQTVRVRRGQRRFRDHLLADQGEICAFTGDAPARVLEAGHLYSYAELGIHHEHGGLLLRRDVHRLFDDGWLAVNPGSGRIDVTPRLAPYPQYARLHDVHLHSDLRDSQIQWLALHWSEHRAG